MIGMVIKMSNINQLFESDKNRENPHLPLPFIVEDRFQETPDTVSLTLVPENPGKIFTFSPGQFNMLYVFGVGECAISISGNAMNTQRLIHTVRSVGKISNALTNLKPGDTIGVRGPFGNGWPFAEARGKDLIIVAGGLGLAPLRPMIYEVLSHRDLYRRVEIVYGARTPRDLLYKEELQVWRKSSEIRLQVTVDIGDREWYGDIGMVTSRIPDIKFDPSNSIAFICGPEIMMHSVAEMLELRGLQSNNVYLSMERNMKCGMGQCGHCQFGPYFVCRDGPVFPYSKLEKFMSVKEV